MALFLLWPPFFLVRWHILTQPCSIMEHIYFERNKTKRTKDTISQATQKLTIVFTSVLCEQCLQQTFIFLPTKRTQFSALEHIVPKQNDLFASSSPASLDNGVVAFDIQSHHLLTLRCIFNIRQRSPSTLAAKKLNDTHTHTYSLSLLSKLRDKQKKWKGSNKVI